MKSQRRIVISFFIIMFTLFGLSLSANAETRLSADELTTLISGNTVEGQYIKWKTTHKMFFEETGKIRRIDSLNNKESGEWEVNKSGELCVSMKKTRCNEVMKRDDGGYNIYRRGNLKFTFDKVLPGNPHNL